MNQVADINTRTGQIEHIIARLMKHESHLSFSSLSEFKSSPHDFIEYKLGQKKETEAMLYGAMLHCLVLEPHDFKNRYFILDDVDICAQIGGSKPRSTNRYKEWKEVAMQEAEGKILVEQDDYIAVQLAANAVKSNRASKKILGMAPQHEVPIDWSYINFKFKGYIDGNGEIMFDLKSCADASPDKFQREIISKSLYLQAAMYLTGTDNVSKKDFYWIAVDKMGGVSVHKAHEHLIDHGIKEYQFLTEKFNECILTESFHQSYDFWSERWDGIFTADKPAWLYK